MAGSLADLGITVMCLGCDMKEHVGLVAGAITGNVYAVINPDDDAELDNPRWLLIQVATADREPVILLRVGLAEYMACAHPDEVQAIATRIFRNPR